MITLLSITLIVVSVYSIYRQYRMYELESELQDMKSERNKYREQLNECFNALKLPKEHVEKISLFTKTSDIIIEELNKKDLEISELKAKIKH